MDRARLALLGPPAAVLGGAALAGRLLQPRLSAALLLLGCGCALGGRAGRVVTAFAAGLGIALAEVVIPVQQAGRIDPTRPVTVSGVAATPWTAADYAWHGDLGVDAVRQAARVNRRPGRIVVSLPPGGEAPPPSRWRLRGYLRPPDRPANGGPTAEGAWHLSVKSLRLAEAYPLHGAAGVWERASRRVRTVASTVLGGGGGGPGAALARALLLGDARAVPAAWRRTLRRCGLSHLLAVSGLHVGMVAGAVLLLTAAWPRWLRTAAVASGLVAYLSLVGPRPSLLRSSAMVLGVLAALLLHRRPCGLHLLAWIAACLVASNPLLVDDLGFCLTVAATAGILLLAPPLAERWGRLPRALRRPLATTVAAQLATTPWLVPAFHVLVPLAPLFNLVFVPWTALVLGGAWVWLLLAAASPALGRSTAPVLDLLAVPFGLLTRMPAGWAPCVPVAWGALTAAVAAVVITWILLDRRRGLLLLALLAAGLTTGAAAPRFAPHLAVIDVGQGDALLLRDGAAALLVDGGGWRAGDEGGCVLLPALARLGVTRLTALAVTHPDRDHCGGLIDLSSYLPTAEVWLPAGLPWGPCRSALERIPGAGLRVLVEGEGLRLGRWRLQVLSAGEAVGRGVDDNDRSLVLRGTAAGVSLLLTGDLGAAGERKLLARWPTPELRSAVLKVAHHGSGGSTTATFLRAVDPRLAVISVGRRNPYGHPAPATLRRLAALHVPVLRTDRDGLVELAFPGRGRLRLALPGSPP